MKKETEKLMWIWIGISIAIIIGIMANCRIDVHQKSYPNIKCRDVTETKLIPIEAGIMNRGREDFWRNDVHFEDDVKMVWCEVSKNDNFYYSEYLKGYGTDFMNMRNESIQCLMKFTEEVCS